MLISTLILLCAKLSCTQAIQIIVHQSSYTFLKHMGKRNSTTCESNKLYYAKTFPIYVCMYLCTYGMLNESCPSSPPKVTWLMFFVYNSIKPPSATQTVRGIDQERPERKAGTFVGQSFSPLEQPGSGPRPLPSCVCLDGPAGISPRPPWVWSKLAMWPSSMRDFHWYILVIIQNLKYNVLESSFFLSGFRFLLSDL